MLEYLQSKYSETGWRFFPLIPILNKFGEEGRNELNELRKQGLVKRRDGINGVLIELIIENK